MYLINELIILLKIRTYLFTWYLFKRIWGDIITNIYLTWKFRDIRYIILYDCDEMELRAKINGDVRSKVPVLQT